MSKLTRKTTLFGLGIAVILSACASVQSDFDLSFSDTPGFDDERLERIDEAVAAEIAAGKISGAVALIAQDGQTVYHKSFGLADVDSQCRCKQIRFSGLRSMTKAITSVGVMMLYEQGYFQLNDPVSDFIPAFKTLRLPSLLVTTAK